MMIYRLKVIMTNECFYQHLYNELHGSYADLASRGRSLATTNALECSHGWVDEHVVLVESSHPEGQRVRKELASSLSLALDVWTGSEVFEARAWAHERLSSAALAAGGVSKERVSHPHTVVAAWASWNIFALRVDSHNVAWGFAHSTSRDIRQDLVAHQGHGRHWHVGGEPVGFTVSVGILAHT